MGKVITNKTLNESQKMIATGISRKPHYVFGPALIMSGHNFADDMSFEHRFCLDASGSIDQAKATITALTKKVTDLTTGLQQAQAAYDNMSSQYTALDAQPCSGTVACQVHSNTLTALKSAMAKLQLGINSINSDLTTAKSDLQKANEELVSLMGAAAISDPVIIAANAAAAAAQTKAKGENALFYVGAAVLGISLIVGVFAWVGKSN